MKQAARAFTLIELLTVLAIIAILAALAVPSMQDRLIRQQIVDAMKLADVAKGPVAAMWTATGKLPADNSAAGLPLPDKIVSDLVSSVIVEAGAIHVGFGNHANAAIRGKTLTLRAAVVEGTPIVPVAWVCGHASAVDKMVTNGTDRTDVDARFLPLNCR